MYFNYLASIFLITTVLFLSTTFAMLCLYRKARQDSCGKEKSIIARTDFFSNIIHELKTPISVILGAIQLIDMKKSHYPVEENIYQKNHLIIKRNCYRLLRLANNLLDFARLDSGYLRLNPVNCNIIYLVEEITQSVIPYARQKQIDLVFDTQIEEIITAVDVDKIERIILNLLSNAIKFTGQGGSICVNTCLSENSACISVKDTGIGIPMDKQEEIFRRFRQVGGTLSKEHEGSGIGLSLVKSFVELHQGNIKIISEPNKGSEFTIDIPIKLAAREESVEPTVSDQRSKIVEAINIEFSDIYSIAS